MRPAGAPPVLLAAAYGGAVLLPALAATAQALPPLPLLAAVGLFTGLAALVMLFAQFVTSGRFELLAGRIGLDVMMGFHRFAARVLLAVVLIHAALSVWLAAGAQTRGIPAALGDAFQTRGLTSGFAALLLLAGVTAMAVRRDRLGLRYEIWRVSHGAAATGAALLALDHAWRNAVTLRFTPVAASVAATAVAALAAAFSIYVLRGRRDGWIVERVAPAGGRLHHVVLKQVSGRPFAFRAGQFVWIALGGRHPISDHPFSIASAPHELPELRLLVKENGDFSGAIGRLAPGTRAAIDGPHGNFVAEGNADAIVLIAGGVGIAPIIGILRDLAARGYRGRVALLIATRSEAEQIFDAEIARLAATLDLHVVACVEAATAAWTGAQGRVDAPKLQHLLSGIDAGRAEVLICGPVAMMAAASEALLRLGVPLRRIRYERFDYEAASDPKSRRVRKLFSALFLAIGLGLAGTALSAAGREAPARGGAPETAGAAAFARACSGCHSIARWQGANAVATTPQSRAALDAFLSRHHAPDPAARGAILDHLASQGR